MAHMAHGPTSGETHVIVHIWPDVTGAWGHNGDTKLNITNLQTLSHGPNNLLTQSFCFCFSEVVCDSRYQTFQEICLGWFQHLGDRN